jgi:hypothetical protein
MFARPEPKESKVFKNFQRLLTEIGRDTPDVRRGLIRALDWRKEYEEEAGWRDQDKRWVRRSVSTALDLPFSVLVHNSVKGWAPEDGDFDGEFLEESLEWLGKRLGAELKALDDECDLAGKLGLRFDKDLWLYESPEKLWFTYQRGPEARFVPWTVERFQQRFLGEDYSYEEVEIAGARENRTVRTFDVGAEIPGFVTNVLTLFHGQPQRKLDLVDHTPDVIADMYAKSFANPQDARDRLKILIGLNAYDTPEKPSVREALRTEVIRAGKEMAGLPGNAVVVGVLWSSEWLDNMRNDFVTVDQVRAALAVVGDDKTNAIGRGYFPFAGMRDYLKDHQCMKDFSLDLSEAGLRVFMHIGDGDPVSLSTPAPVEGLKLPLVPLTSDGLLDRFDEVWATVPTGQKPGIARVSGGFALRTVMQRGDLNPMESTVQATILANELDMAVRTVLGEAAYFPEPNTFVDMSFVEGLDLAQDQLTFPEPDLGPLLGRLSREEKLRSLFDSRLSLVTSGRHAKVSMKLAGIHRLAEWLEQKNHSASFTAWTFRLEEYHGLEPGTAVAVMKKNLDQGEKMMLALAWGTSWSSVKAFKGELKGGVEDDITGKAKATVALFRQAADMLKDF